MISTYVDAVYGTVENGDKEKIKKRPAKLCVNVRRIFSEDWGRGRTYNLVGRGDRKLFHSIINFMEEQTKVLTASQHGKLWVKSGRQ